MNATISYIEESNADKAIKALTAALAPRAKAVRDGQVRVWWWKGERVGEWDWEAGGQGLHLSLEGAFSGVPFPSSSLLLLLDVRRPQPALQALPRLCPGSAPGCPA